VARTLSPGGNCNGTPAYDISSGMLFIPSSNGNLYKVNPANGSTAGMYNAGSAIVGGVCLINGRAFVSAGSTVKAVDIAGMTEAWSYSAGSPVVMPPAYSSSRDAVVVVTQNLNVHCIKNSDGSAKWSPVKPTPGTYSSGSTEADWGWPVIAEVHGYVLVRYRLPWSTLWTWSPWPTDNATMRSNLQGNPSQQCVFALDLDDGSVPFICNVGNGGWGDNDFLPMGPAPCVRKFDNGNEVAYTVCRGDSGSGQDGRSDSHFGELMLDNTTVSGWQAGYVRFIDYGSDFGGSEGFAFPPTDEQPFITVAGDQVLAGHWALGLALQMNDRSASRGTFASPITVTYLSHFVTSQQSQGFSASHYVGTPFGQEPDWREVPLGFYIYYNLGSVYDSYWSNYACWVVSDGLVLYRSCDSAIIALESGNPLAAVDRDPTWGELAEAAAAEEHYRATDNPRAVDRPARGPAIITHEEVWNHVGEVKTVAGTIRYIHNNGKTTCLGFKNPHQGAFAVMIRERDRGNFPAVPEEYYRIGQAIRVTGKIVWYQGDPVVYAEHPDQIEIVHQFTWRRPER